MNNRIKVIIIAGVCMLPLLFGCAHHAEQTQPKSDKKVIYTPMQINEEIPALKKDEDTMGIDKNVIDRDERDRVGLRDFDKYMAERDKRLRKK